MVEADAASDMAMKGDGNKEWRRVTRMIVQVLRLILLPTVKSYSCEIGISHYLHAQPQTPSIHPTFAFSKRVSSFLRRWRLSSMSFQTASSLWLFTIENQDHPSHTIPYSSAPTIRTVF
jgi:hypothetical protein